MARPRSDKVLAAKQKLIARIKFGEYSSGDRFLSNRAIAARLGVSYQTADRLVRELCAEGLLERRAASGTFIAGRKRYFDEAILLFHSRAKRPNSFGAYLLSRLKARLEREGVPFQIAWKRVKIEESAYPVVWERPYVLAGLAKKKRGALVLTEEPPLGFAARFFDCVTIDEYCGGVMAGEIFLEYLRQKGLSSENAVRKMVVVSGPADDKRSVERMRGFCSILPVREINAGGWDTFHGKSVAARALRSGTRGIFCCNDRLAEAIIKTAEKNEMPCPPIIGFDDAPTAEQLNLTTIANPWEDLCKAAAGLIKDRLSGDRSPATRKIFNPFPVFRSFAPLEKSK